jgi:hypothetical protein
MNAPILHLLTAVNGTKRQLPRIYDAGPLLRVERQRSCDCREGGFEFPGARQLGNRPIRPRAAPTSKVRKTLDTTLTAGTPDIGWALDPRVGGHPEFDTGCQIDTPRVVGTAHQAAAISTFLNMAWESLRSRFELQCSFQVANARDPVLSLLGE